MPLNVQTRETLDRIFITLAGMAGEEAPLLQVNHRPLQAIRAVDGVLAVDFHTLCEEARSQLDYIALSRRYHSVMLYNVQVMEPRKKTLLVAFWRWWMNSMSATLNWCSLLRLQCLRSTKGNS